MLTLQCNNQHTHFLFSMKKVITLALVAVTTAFAANAQFAKTLKDHDIFNHLGVSAGVGTTGITVELGTTITPWVQMRAGVDFMPKFSLKTSLDLEEYGVDASQYYQGPELNEIDVKGQLKNTTGHVIFDIFPFAKKSSFHISAGAYFGPSSVITATNTSGQDLLQEVYEYNHRMGQWAGIPDEAGKVGATLGDYFIEPDANGNLAASIKVKKFRPYVGIGFGRIVPKRRINCLFDLGVQFWGKPEIWNDTAHERLTEEGANGDDGGVIKTISKVSVYPVLSIKLVGKIF